MTESHRFRRENARQLAISAERAFLYRCKTLGIEPDTVTGSPLLVIADRQAQIAAEKRKTHG